MKFGSILFGSLLVCLVGNFLFGSLLEESLWLPAVVAGIVQAVVVYAYVQQGDKIEELEKRIKALEEKKED